MQKQRIAIIGGGLAGSEAALQLAKRGLTVTLYDMKPAQCSAAHHSKTLAEIVCSNSFGSQGPATASGLLKLEMEQLGCELLAIAREVSVPAGKALAVDRDRFTEAVTRRIQAEPLIHLVCKDVTELPEADFILIATGPLTSPGLVATMSRLLQREQLYFFDAASPIIVKDSINLDVAFFQDRYGLERAREKTQLPETNGHTQEDKPQEDKTESSDASYINCPLDKAQYDALMTAILAAEKTELKLFEKDSAQYFESCLPIEVLAGRGEQTLRYGPFKPVGLVDPRTGKSPYAVVQLRQDNHEGTLYNMVGCQTNIKWGPQQEIIHMIPGLETAEIVRYGVMHRNTYIHSPEVLTPSLQLKQHPHILFAGQLTGTEGYTESVATGLVAALTLERLCQWAAPNNTQGDIQPQAAPTLPPLLAPMLPKETMLGALLHYITRPEAIGKSFQPINSNWGILPPLESPADPALAKRLRRNKAERNAQYVERALAALPVTAI